jgi:periplasmic protein TonB
VIAVSTPLDPIEPDTPKESRGFLVWIVPVSIAAHVALVAILPNAARSRGPLPPLVVEMTTDLPEPPPPPKREATPENAPAPTARAAPRPVANAAPRPAATSAARPTSDDTPMDFTSTTFSNDGPGMAIGPSAPVGSNVSTAAPIMSAAPRITAAEAPRFVPAANLSRPPRAPGLDADLERNYPAEARRTGVSGTAVLRVEILPDGRVGKVERVSESFGGFGEACTRTVRAGKWQPPLDKDGRPVSTQITYTCRFEVRS